MKLSLLNAAVALSLSVSNAALAQAPATFGTGKIEERKKPEDLKKSDGLKALKEKERLKKLGVEIKDLPVQTKPDKWAKELVKPKAGEKKAVVKVSNRQMHPKIELITKLKSKPAAQLTLESAEHASVMEALAKTKVLIDSNLLDPKLRTSLKLHELPLTPKSTYTPKELDGLRQVVTLFPPRLQPRSLDGLRSNNAAITLPGAPTPLSPEEEKSLTAVRSDDDELRRRLAAAGRVAAPDSGNSIRGRRTEAFNPLGFLEVVLILVGNKTCTGTMLNSQVVLTAAHCVKDVPLYNIEVRVPRYDPEKLAACRAAWSQQQRYVFCADLELARPFSSRVHPAYDEARYVNDVALITLETPDYSRSTAAVEFRSQVPDRLTLAGYGETLLADKKDYRARFALEVGWHSGASVQAKNGMIEWISHKDDPQSSTCSGDSGGPIFAGDNKGIGDTPSPRVVFAIVSNASKPTCVDYTVRQTLLSEKAVKEWLCDQLSSWIGGCTPTLLLSENRGS